MHVDTARSGAGISSGLLRSLMATQACAYRAAEPFADDAVVHAWVPSGTAELQLRRLVEREDGNACRCLEGRRDIRVTLSSSLGCR